MAKVDPNELVAFWMEKGFTEPQARGIVRGGPQRESDFDSTRWGDDGTSFGLYQHHGSRLDALMKSDPNFRDWRVQSEFAWQELNTTEKRALQAIRGATTEGAAAQAMKTAFERPAASGGASGGGSAGFGVSAGPKAAFPGPGEIGGPMGGSPTPRPVAVANVPAPKAPFTPPQPISLPSSSLPRAPAPAMPNLSGGLHNALAAILAHRRLG